jgi:hypothetical protein
VTIEFGMISDDIGCHKLRYRLSFPRGVKIKVHYDLLLAMLRAHGEALARLLCDNGRLLEVDEVVALG